MTKNLPFVIKGSLKNKKIPMPSVVKGFSNATSQKIKEAVFQIIENYAHDYPQIIFFDIFSGCGQMGIEALSRGAAFSVFCEWDSKRLSDIRSWIYDNDLDDRASFIKMDGLRLLKSALAMPKDFHKKIFRENINSENYHLVFFADPPYSFVKNNVPIFLEILNAFKKFEAENKFLSALLVVQSATLKTKFKLPNAKKTLYKKMPEILEKYDKSYVYGKNQILVYSPK
ncbi:MAG: RsmD family RNA methyltransferase [Spirochaetia bacterium]|nr:RsmD family RNA methyltransferase [Spirochaetia bacterium]